MSQHDRYISPFSTRYASDEMQYIFSDDNKFRTWRRLWVALARAEMNQGLTNITPDMVAELEAHVDDINYEVAIEREKLVRHDVMSHVYAYGQQCPKAAGIIHLGATSCYVGDNTDIIVMRQGLELVRKKLIGVLAKLARFAEEYKDMPCMAYTDCQPAQPTTVGKRARRSTTVWLLCSCAASRVPPAPRHPSWSCSRAMPTRSVQWTLPLLRRWALTPRPSSRCPARPTAARWTPLCSTHWPASARAA